MDAQTAIDEINARNAAGNPMSVVELQNLSSSVDASTGGASLILNSGGVGDLQPDGLYEFSSQRVVDVVNNNHGWYTPHMVA